MVEKNDAKCCLALSLTEVRVWACNAPCLQTEASGSLRKLSE